MGKYGYSKNVEYGNRRFQIKNDKFTVKILTLDTSPAWV